MAANRKLTMHLTVRGLQTGIALLLAFRAAAFGEPRAVAYRNTAPGVGYVGSKACAACHRDIYDEYIKTGMGQSMSLASDPAQLAKVPHSFIVHDEKLNRYFQVSRQGSKLLQSEYELGPSGSEVFRNTQEIAYVVGSGMNGLGYLVRQGNYLLEAPLSFYSKSNSWGLSPGYELGDYGFTRTVPASCLSCHSGLPRPAPSGYGLYRDPPFRELAIGCENCHGPGQLHVEARTQGARLEGAIDTTIVNPAKLSPWLADNICMNCHQGGDTRVLQPGKDYADFRPGTPLDRTVAIFAVPLTPASPPAEPLLEHYSLMILSKCYRASGGRMSCLTCHNPHQQPRSAAYYRQRCLTCHTEKSCPLPLATRNQSTPPDDCVGCHMPRQRLTLISHSVLTNHRIVVREDEPYPDIAFHQTTPELPDLVHVNAVPGERDTVPALTLFRAYSELQGSHPQYRAPYLTLLDQLAQARPEDALVLSALAWKSVSTGTPEGREAAVRYLSQAIDLGSVTTTDFESLGDLLARSEHTADAIAVVERGIKLDPYDERLYKTLAFVNISAHRYPEALAAMKKALELFPEDDFMRELVRKAEQSSPAP